MFLRFQPVIKPILRLVPPLTRQIFPGKVVRLTKFAETPAEPPNVMTQQQ